MSRPSRLQFRFPKLAPRGATVLIAILTALSGTGCANRGGTTTPTGASVSGADALMSLGTSEFSRGEFGLAATSFNKAAAAYAAVDRPDGRCDALLNAATAYEQLGQYTNAAQSLNTARTLVRLADEPRVVAVYNGVGVLHTLTRQFDLADAEFEHALGAARFANDLHSQWVILENIGNLRVAQDRSEEAGKSYEQAAELARGADDSTGVARASANAALAAANHGNSAAAKALNQTALTAIQTVPIGHDKAAILLVVGQAFEKIGGANAADQSTLEDARSAYYQALTAGQAVGDKLSCSYACGYAGRTFEQQHRNEPAMQFTRRAAFYAQDGQSSFAVYLWQWQTARLLAATGDVPDAISAYQHAVTTLATIENDVASGYGNQGSGGSFRESVGPLFYQLADLLLRQADQTHDEQDQQRLLREARQAVETLKSAEIEDYFRSPCATLLKAKARTVEQIGKHTAVVYVIPLPDRIELLVGLGSEMKRVKVDVGSETLTTEVRAFREQLENRTTNAYLRHARKLYDWLIRPIDPMLAAAEIDTLVFVPDGALRTVPMGALQDGHDFLIQKYALAITPGLTLMDPRPILHGNGNVLGAGLSQPVMGFPALEFVPEELKSLHEVWGGDSLLNQQFSRANFQKAMADNNCSIVHIASHAQFNGDVHRTFLLTYDGELTLDGLEGLIRPSLFKDRPVELLTLSACETAAGDDRAALGLAGVAIKAGARSAIATLWSVNDEASSLVISDFYTRWHNDPRLSKAKAMQRAQRKLLEDSRYSHPAYWSPYLVIGNWL